MACCTRAEAPNTSHIDTHTHAHTVALKGLATSVLGPSQHVRARYVWKGGGREESAG